MPDTDLVRVLFVCSENAARSQMAEGWLRAHGGDRYAVFSAGTTPSAVHPLAVQVMDEVGIDIRGQHSKGLDVYQEDVMDYVVTLCDETRELSPSIRAADLVIHQPFDDPSAVDEAERLDAFRTVRDALATWIERAFLLETA